MIFLIRAPIVSIYSPSCRKPVPKRTLIIIIIGGLFKNALGTSREVIVGTSKAIYDYMFTGLEASAGKGLQIFCKSQCGQS